ncbi:MAG: hypothetical protein HQK55_19475, partial [Deltaproteobacteria bacterium]|nr:hypothetical protein [Deltaproteobacteria bacterium]
LARLCEKGRPAGGWIALASPLFSPYIKILVVAFVVMIASWPFALMNPLLNPFIALREMSHFDIRGVYWPGPVLYDGRYFSPDQLPSSYLPFYMLIQLPEVIVIMVL